MIIEFTPTIKQDQVFELFDEDGITELLYGGGVGAAKTYLIAALAIIKCLQHPKIRVGLARNELTTLKKTTAVTFFEVLSSWGLEPIHDYKYNSIEGNFTFSNGSEVIFSELSYRPSDPDYTRLGGLLLTFALIDEAGECDSRGKEIYQSRIGRWMNEEFNIKPLLIMTCNPSRNFLYDDFHTPSKEGTLAKHRAFVNATVYDNPYIPQSYIDNLKLTLSSSEQQRLLNGNWDYDGDPNNLLDLTEVKNLYTNIVKTEGTKYISADIAFTSDKCIVLLWDGLVIEQIHNLTNDENREEFITTLASSNGVSQTNISYDSDGVGKYLAHHLRSARPIVNNSKAIGGENYINLKTQLYFKAVQLIKEGKLKIEDPNFKKDIEQELLAIKHKPKDTSESKIEMNSKADVKRLIGRSPDFADAIAYRMIFEIKKAPSRPFVIR